MTQEQAKKHIERILKQTVIHAGVTTYRMKWKLKRLAIVDKKKCYFEIGVYEVVEFNNYFGPATLKRIIDILSPLMYVELEEYMHTKCNNLFGSQILCHFYYSDHINDNVYDQDIREME